MVLVMFACLVPHMYLKQSTYLRIQKKDMANKKIT
jgi:hypothetical protein